MVVASCRWVWTYLLIKIDLLVIIQEITEVTFVEPKSQFILTELVKFFKTFNLMLRNRNWSE